MLVVCRTQFERFFSLLEKPIDDEVYFISLSARNKYLTEEERREYSLGKTEMFGRTIVYDFEDLPYIERKLEGILSARRTRSGLEFPQKALVTYTNINPSSTVKASHKMAMELTGDLYSLYKKEKRPEDFKSVEKRILNHIQRCRSRQVFIDIDMDKVGESVVDAFANDLGCPCVIVTTQGGYHVLIKKESMRPKFNLWRLVSKYDEIAKEFSGEVVINKNQMVPVPGTLQANKMVTMREII